MQPPLNKHYHGQRLAVICLLGMFLLSLSCSRKPDMVLGKKEMASLLTDVHKGESLIEINHNQFSSDSMRRVMKQSVLDAHGVTQQQWDSSLSYYGRNIEQYIELYDIVIAGLEQELKNANVVSQGSNIQMEVVGDSADTWDQPRLRHFSAKQPTDILKFYLRRDLNWDRGDVYTWNFKAINGSTPITWTIAAEYSDGTTEYKSGTTASSGWTNISFHTDSSRTTSSIRGVATLRPSADESVYIDSISLVRTRHEKAPAAARAGIMQFSNGKKIK